jgi:hypothetical protein
VGYCANDRMVPDNSRIKMPAILAPILVVKFSMNNCFVFLGAIYSRDIFKTCGFLLFWSRILFYR